MTTPVMKLAENVEDAMRLMTEIDEISERLPQLDCGSCGAPTCRALAEDIVRGEASEKDCIYWMRENLHKLSREVTQLAQDMAESGKEKSGKLPVLMDYVRQISSEITYLDSRVQEPGSEEEQEETT